LAVDRAVNIEEVKFSYTDRDFLAISKLEILRGERVFLVGPSGSGKTTLLGLITGILSPKGGQIRLLGKDMAEMSSHKRDVFRGTHVGYIFQMFNLIPYLNVFENIVLPLKTCPERRKNLARRKDSDAVFELARGMGIGDLMKQRVNHLSVGQQQRVAACRALIGSPEIIIADEPTSALDQDQRESFLQILMSQVEKCKSTLIFVSHDLTLKPYFSRQIPMGDINFKPLTRYGT
jgi:putative ABC transport system ATP-binding protein